MAIAVGTIRPNPTLIAAKIDTDTVLLDIDTGIYFGLDEVGTRIWDLACEGATEEEIVAQLRDEYEAEPEQLWADLRDFVEELRTRGLVLDTDD